VIDFRSDPLSSDNHRFPCFSSHPPFQYRHAVDVRVSYEYSYASDPRRFVAQVPDQLVTDVPVTIPRALLPEYIVGLILNRSPKIGRVRDLRLL
jgi:hypothetical protein